MVIKGTVVSVDDTAIVVQSDGNMTRTVTLSADTPIVAPDGSATTIAVGDDVRAVVRVTSDGTTPALLVQDLSADGSTDQNPPDGTGTPTADTTSVPAQPTDTPSQDTGHQDGTVVSFEATVISFDGTTLVVQGTDNPITITLPPHVSIGAAPGAPSTLAAGERVRIYALVTRGDNDTVNRTVKGVLILPSGAPQATATPSSDAQSSATPQPQPTQEHSYGSVQRLDGTITALGNGSLTVQAADGPHTFPLNTRISIRLANGSWGTIDQVPTNVPASVFVRAIDGGPLVVVGIIVGGAK